VKQTIGGFMPALVTPFQPNGDVDQKHLRKLAAYQLGKGVTGFYVCGSTGQGLYMSVQNRKRAAEAVIEETSGAVPVIVQVGSMVAADAVELARHAAKSGAAAISSVLPPMYGNVATLAAYFGELSRAAPETPLFPYLANASIDVPVLMEKLCTIPTVEGTKYTGPNMDELRQVIEIGRSLRPRGEWVVMAGMDEQCVFAAMVDATGNIGSSLNVIPGPYRVIWELHRAGKHTSAMEMQLRANGIVTVLKRYGYAAALRGALNLLGVECSAPCLPDRPLDDQAKKGLERDLAKAGFAELAAL
jgi:N-acetylneuraminate lyase